MTRKRRSLICIDTSNAGLNRVHRAFSSASIARYADDSKDKLHESTVKQDDGEKEKPSAPSAPSESAIGSATTNSTPSPAADTKSNTQSALLSRLRSATASLPSLDGLTSSTSLSTITSHTSSLLASLRTKLSQLSSQYNTHTGYTAIETLKSRISTLESSLDSARVLASTAKKTYLQAVQSRSASQRETNDLLSRKASWDERDLSRYTELLRKEHALSRQESEAEKVLERTEAQVQACFDELMKAVMVRYHEEQIWSDRMRGMSTYGSLVVAGLNGKCETVWCKGVWQR